MPGAGAVGLEQVRGRPVHPEGAGGSDRHDPGGDGQGGSRPAAEDELTSRSTDTPGRQTPIL